MRTRDRLTGRVLVSTRLNVTVTVTKSKKFKMMLNFTRNSQQYYLTDKASPCPCSGLLYSLQRPEITCNSWKLFDFPIFLKSDGCLSNSNWENFQLFLFFLKSDGYLINSNSFIFKVELGSCSNFQPVWLNHSSDRNTSLFQLTNANTLTIYISISDEYARYIYNWQRTFPLCVVVYRIVNCFVRRSFR